MVERSNVKVGKTITFLLQGKTFIYLYMCMYFVFMYLHIYFKQIKMLFWYIIYSYIHLLGMCLYKEMGILTEKNDGGGGER